MPDDDNPRKDAPEEDLDAEIAELEQKLQEAVEGQPLTEEDEQRVAEIAERLDSEHRLDAFLEKHDSQVEALQEIAENVRAERPSDTLDDEFDAKLRSIEERARTARTRKSTGLKSPERDRQLESDRSAARGLGVGLSIAYTMLGLPVFGWGVGWLLDRNTDSNVFVPLFTLGGAVVGIAMAVYMVNREQNRK